MLLHPIILQKLAHVVPSAICKEDHDSLVLPNVVILDEAVCTCHRRTTAATNHETLMSDDIASHEECFVIIGLDPMVDNILVQDSWDEIISDAFNLVSLKPLVTC